MERERAAAKRSAGVRQRWGRLGIRLLGTVFPFGGVDVQIVEKWGECMGNMKCNVNFFHLVKLLGK